MCLAWRQGCVSSQDLGYRDQVALHCLHYSCSSLGQWRHYEWNELWTRLSLPQPVPLFPLFVSSSSVLFFFFLTRSSYFSFGDIKLSLLLSSIRKMLRLKEDKKHRSFLLPFVSLTSNYHNAQCGPTLIIANDLTNLHSSQVWCCFLFGTLGPSTRHVHLEFYTAELIFQYYLSPLSSSWLRLN